MKTICLFAGYDKKGSIEDYVIYYVKELAKFCDVYYMGDFDTTKKELAKLKPYTKDAIAYRHGRYDYGSWDELIKKIGWENIKKYDQLILANDSCYGPLYPFDEVFNHMSKNDCDFWGLSCGKGYHIHLQSYFLVFRKNVLKTDHLKLFLSNVKIQKTLHDVCELYEDQITFYLKKNGFSYASYIPYGEFKLHPYYETWNCIREKRFPLLKVKVFDGVVGYDDVKSWKKFIKNVTNYDPKMIVDNLHHRGYKDADIDLAVHHWRKNSKLKSTLSKIKKFPKKVARRMVSPLWSRYILKFDQRFNQNAMSIENNINRVNNSIKSLEQKIKFYPNILNDKVSEDEIISFFYKYDLINKSNLIIKTNDKVSVKNLNDKNKLNNDFISNELVVDYLKFHSFMYLFRSIPMFRKTDKINILLCGNMYENVVMEYILGHANVVSLNNDFIRKDTLEEKLFSSANIIYKTDLLSDFSFYQDDVSFDDEIDNNMKRAFFDLVIINQFTKSATSGEIVALLYNFSKNMLDESILIMSIPHGAKVMEDFDDILEEVGLYWNHEYQELLEKCFINMEKSNCFVIMKK